MVRVVALVAFLVCCGVAQAAETRSNKSAANSPSLLTALRGLIAVKPSKKAIRPPARVAVAAKPATAPKPARPMKQAVVATAALASVGMAASSPAQSNKALESMPSCSGERVMTAFYSEGEVTASGEPFNPEAFAAAHRSLPFGTQVMLTNPRNGRSVTVTINDRGPFVTGVALDLTAGAARALGMTRAQMLCMW